jgi:hypothetical protein
VCFFLVDASNRSVIVTIACHTVYLDITVIMLKFILFTVSIQEACLL